MKLCSILLLLHLSAFSLGQDLDLSKQFVVLKTSKTKDVVKQLLKAGDAGYRVRAASVTGSTDITVLLEKAQAEPVSYRVFIESDMREIKARVKAAGEEGYQLIRTALFKRGKITSNKELVVFMERAKDTKPQEYLVLVGSFEANLTSVLSKATAQNYTVAGMLSGKEKVAIFMERPAQE